MELPLQSEYTFDLEYWTKTTRSSAVNERVREGFRIVGPPDMVFRERLRAQTLSKFEHGISVPTDAFVFATGEPKRRDVTKIGGAPYRSANMPWPTDAGGKAFTFLAQFRFCESQDIVGRLPGDLLLVFAQGATFPFRPRQDFLRFEWVTLGEGKLLSRKETPEPAWTFVTAYGLRHRTLDYAADVPYELVHELVPTWSQNPAIRALYAKQFSRVQGMKIGGLPVYEIVGEYGVQPHLARRCKSAKLLCALADVYPEFSVPYPWANRPAALRASAASAPKSILDFRDGFVLTIWIEDSGELLWTIQFVEG